MTRLEVLRIVVRQARINGFLFRKWYQAAIDPAWNNFEEALAHLARGRRYYALLFAHEFAQAFWKQGAQIHFVVPAASYTRRNKQGRIVTVNRKPFTRRTLKADAWKYHLREMATHDEPVRYIRRFLVIEGGGESDDVAAS